MKTFQSTTKDMNIQINEVFLPFQISSLFSFKNYSADKGVMRQAIAHTAGGM